MKNNAKAIGVVIALMFSLVGCSAGASPNCDVVGVDGGVDVTPFAVELAEGEYPIRGNTITDPENPAGVGGVSLTITGDGFSTVVCSDSEGKWGTVVPAPAPYTITLNSVPDGFQVANPQPDPDGVFSIDEQSIYPATFTILFAKGDASTPNEAGGSGGGDSDPAPAGNAPAGAWGGFTFPGNIDGYRLIGESEYAEFREVHPGPTVCTFLGGALYGETVASDGGGEMLNVPYVNALYTSSAQTMVNQGCGATETIISISWTGTENIGGVFADAPADANGNRCVVVATHMCGTIDPAGGTWTAADLSSEVPLDQVSDFLHAVRAGG